MKEMKDYVERLISPKHSEITDSKIPMISLIEIVPHNGRRHTSHNARSQELDVECRADSNFQTSNLLESGRRDLLKVVVTMEQLQHFSHDHLLSLVHMQPQDKHESSDDEDGDGDDFVVEDQHGGKCNMCKEHIYSFHLCYYECKECDYSLHKFCAQLPKTLQNHSLHPGHNLTLSEGFQGPDPYFEVRDEDEWKCDICYLRHKSVFNYHCSMCQFSMDIICATISEQKMDHPCHPHQLERMFKPMTANCNACEKKQTGTFYYCNTCQFSIHLDCALLPKKLLIQQPTNETFTHSHPLTLAYSFPYINLKAKFFPRCRVCNDGLSIFSWLYRCEKCQYYVHVNCATSKTEPFMSIFLRASLGKTLKNFDDDKHPNLLNCPFPDESYSLLKHLFVNEKDFIDEGNNGKILNYHGHQHPLILFETQTSLGDKSSFLHNPMTKCQLLCDGCVKPIVTVPFYKCSQHVEQCGFVLHTWCASATLPSEVQDHPGHPKHTLTLMRNIPAMFFDVFWCEICRLPSNGFAYGCMACGYYVDINCAFIPENITHEAHPNHLLSRMLFPAKRSKRYCNACKYTMKKRLGFYCQSCDFYLHTECALFLPRMIRHKYDKHPLSLRYYPVENHISEYFCEICEDEINPRRWFYHCTTCVWSMHAACGPLILQCEQAAVSRYKRCVFEFLNVKFGRTLMIKRHPHHLSFVQGVERDGLCNECDEELQFRMIFKCFKCEFALHYECAFMLDCNHSL